MKITYTIKSITKGLLLLVFLSILLSGCGGGSSSTSDDTNNTDTGETNNPPIVSNYILYEDENDTVSVDATLLAQSEDTKVKLTRNIEEQTVDIHVIKGSVEVSVP